MSLTGVIKVCEIDWETDGEEIDLPDSVTIDIEELDNYCDLETESQVSDAICDYLSDTYGWLVSGYTRVERTRKLLSH
tara:strand:+ start:1709 stop:1942 length:234 start_codon:yes stop_codon:yes gene_type:complete